MNYLGRPIFPFSINWAKAIARSVTFDLRETGIGFGAEFFTPTQTYTANVWEFSLTFKCGADILSFESFCDSLVGRLQGFWLPCPLQAAVFAAPISATQFKIVDEDLASTWNSRPDKHLLFTFPDGTQAAGLIQAVASNGDGTETVTMSAALAEAPAAGTRITRLHYVRWSADEENLPFLAESIAGITLQAVELPLEYTNAATGLQPIYLYHFWMKAPVKTDWYFTSFASAVVSNGVLYTAFQMSHKAIKKTTDGNASPVDMTARPDDAHPFSMMSGMPPGKVLWCEISSAKLGSPNTVQSLFVGFVKKVDDNGTDYTAQAVDRLDWLKSKSPGFYIGSVCNYDLYDQNTCKVARAPFETTVTIASIVAGELPVLRCTFNFAFQLINWKKVDWFKGGTLETNVGVQYDLRSIVASQWDGNANQLLLTLNAPLRAVNAVAGAQLLITAGCDHTIDGVNGCTIKFNNRGRFGGHIDVPDQNLSLQGLNTSVAQGNKKGS